MKIQIFTLIGLRLKARNYPLLQHKREVKEPIPAPPQDHLKGSQDHNSEIIFSFLKLRLGCGFYLVSLKHLKLYLFTFILSEMQRKRYRPSVGSLPKCPEHSWLGKAETRSLELHLGLPRVWQDQSTWHLPGSWIWSRGAKPEPRAPTQAPGIPAEDLTDEYTSGTVFLINKKMQKHIIKTAQLGAQKVLVPWKKVKKLYQILGAPRSGSVAMWAPKLIRLTPEE